MAAADSDELAAVCAGRGLFSRRRQPVSFKWRWSPGRIDSLCGVSQAGYHCHAKSCRLEGRHVDTERGWRHRNRGIGHILETCQRAGTSHVSGGRIVPDRQAPRRPDGTLGGVSVVVARTLAAHLGVPIELKPYDNPARYNESLATDEWDIGLAARDPARADHLAFSAIFMEVDNGYVARPDAAPANADEVDRPGVKIAVAQGSAPHTALRRLIRNAEIIPVPGGFEPAREALATGKADVYGENLHLAHRIADALPGARVLPGRFNVVQMAIGVRKQAASALSTVDEFVSQIRSDGTVQKAISEAGLRGVRVP